MYILYALQHNAILNARDHLQIFYTHLYGAILTVNLTENHMTF